MSIDPELAAARTEVVREHMDSENRGDFDATLATFSHPRYELIGTGEVFDGADEVRGYFEANRVAWYSLAAAAGAATVRASNAARQTRTVMSPS